MYKLLIPLFALALLVMGCTPQQSPAEPETTDAFAGQLLHGSHRVILKTPLGDITLKLDADAAPKTVTNFVALAQTGYYNELTFHRVIPDFMIQGGDPEGNGTGGESIFGVNFEDEISAKSYALDTQKLKDVSEEELPAELQEMTLQEYYELQGYRYRDDLKSLPMDRGALAMANSGPNTNGSQFFIIQREGGTPWLEGRHTVFGMVVEGMDVVDAIANVERGANDLPLTPVTFSVEILQ